MKKELQINISLKSVRRRTNPSFGGWKYIVPFFMLIGMTGHAQTAYIGNAGDNNVFVVNVATNTVTDTIAVGGFPYGVTVSKDGQKVYVSNRTDRTVSVINTANDSVLATIAVDSSAYGLVVTPDGSKVYVAGANTNVVSVINTATNTVVAIIPVGRTPEGIAVSPDGSKVYVANANDSSVSVINTSTNTVTDSIKPGYSPYGICVSPDGSKIYITMDGTSTVSVVDAATDTVMASIHVGATPWAINVSPDGSRVYAASINAGSVSVINTATNTVVATITISSPEGISVTPDGTEVYVTSSGSGTVKVISTATNTVSATIPVGSLPISFGNFISYAAAPPVAAFQASDNSLCTNGCINFTDESTHSPTSWSWTFSGAIDSTSTAQNPQTVCYQNAGTFAVKLVASNSGGKDSVTVSSYVTVNPTPPAPTIVQSNDTLYCVDSATVTYQWYNDSVLIHGATQQFYVVTQGGDYSVNVTNASGCSVAAAINGILGIPSLNKYGIQGTEFTVYPNPSTDGEFNISFNGTINKGSVKIFNTLGVEVYAGEIDGKQQSINSKLSSPNESGVLRTGIYFVRVTEGERIYTRKILVE